MSNEYLDWLADNLIDPEKEEPSRDKENLDNEKWRKIENEKGKNGKVKQIQPKLNWIVIDVELYYLLLKTLYN